jgi:CobQ-like glutamine amidotransferase family enzyme
VTREQPGVVTIGLVYPELLGTYGDRGNAVALASRLRARGMPAEIVEIRAGTPLPASLDVYVIGGGEDEAQMAALGQLRRSRRAVAAALDGGAQIVAVCAGFQILGSTIRTPDGQTVGGLGLFDGATVPAKRRRVGELTVEATDRTLGLINGFENHRSVTHLGPDEAPLGKVVSGRRRHRTEGLVRPGIIATYMHGPVLVRNPALADAVLTRVLGPLPPATEELSDALHDERVRANGPKHRTAWRDRRASRRAGH